jgi:hypothetical protein
MGSDTTVGGRVSLMSDPQPEPPTNRAEASTAAKPDAVPTAAIAVLMH